MQPPIKQGTSPQNPHQRRLLLGLFGLMFMHLALPAPAIQRPANDPAPLAQPGAPSATPPAAVAVHRPAAAALGNASSGDACAGKAEQKGSISGQQSRPPAPAPAKEQAPRQHAGLSNASQGNTAAGPASGLFGPISLQLKRLLPSGLSPDEPSSGTPRGARLTAAIALGLGIVALTMIFLVPIVGFFLGIVSAMIGLVNLWNVQDTGFFVASLGAVVLGAGALIIFAVLGFSLPG